MPGLPKSSRNKYSIMVVVDRFSKMTNFVPYSKTFDVTNIVDLYFKKIVRLYDIPKTITSNWDSKFMSPFWRTFWRKLDTIFNLALLVIYKLIGKLNSSIKVWEVFWEVWWRRILEIEMLYYHKLNSLTSILLVKILVAVVKLNKI